MNLKKFAIIFCALGAAAVVASPTAQAAFVSVEATDNATVQPAGPRTGSSGKSFLNVEGSNNNAFASFGVADFVFPSPGELVTGVSNVTLKLTQSNAGFSLTGPVSFYLTDNTSVSIQPGTPPAIIYQAGNNGAASIDPVLSPLASLGTGVYTVVSTGTVDSYALNFTGGALTSLLSAINSGTPLRLLVAPDAATTAATWAGNTSTSLAGPTLEFTTIPEPSSVFLVGLLGVALTGLRRR
jgi:hypothetical protein